MACADLNLNGLVRLPVFPVARPRWNLQGEDAGVGVLSRGGHMSSRTVSRVSIASASALIACGALAIPASAQAVTVGPHQYFLGQVFGPTSAVAPNVIVVACAGPESTGHPVPGQNVEVQLFLPPVNTTLGYTGNSAKEIDANLIYSRGPVTVVTFVATLTSYFVKVAIPTSITVPCAGTGVMSFTPSPDPDNSGRASDVNVTFASPGV
jgi:hypothetical protein